MFLSGETAYISVWEKQASKIREELELLKGEPIVVIVTSLNPKLLHGMSQLSLVSFRLV